MAKKDSTISQAVLGFLVGFLALCVLGLCGIGVYQVVDWCTDNTAVEEEASETEDGTETEDDATVTMEGDTIYYVA